MSDRDSVIQELQIIRTWAACGAIRVTDNERIKNALDDALAILKAQEPKIISLNEADRLPYVWLESDSGGLGLRRVRIVPEDSTAVGIMAFGLQTTFHEVSIFEKHFRCWSSKPTDEQRQAAKWG